MKLSSEKVTPTWTPKIRGEYGTKKYDLKEEKKRTNKN